MLLPIPPPALQAPQIRLRYGPPIGSRAEYAVRSELRTTEGAKPPVEAVESVVFTERVVAARPGGGFDVNRFVSSRTLSLDPGTGVIETDLGAAATTGATLRYRVSPSGVWTPVGPRRATLGFLSLAFPSAPVALNAPWTDATLAPHRLAVERLATFAGRRAAIVRVLPPEAGMSPSNSVAADSHLVLDLAEGRPLFARLSVEATEGATTFAGTVILRRTDIPGLIPRLEAGTD